MFELTLLETSVEGKQRRAWAWGLSALLQVVLVSALTLVPLLYLEVLPRRLLVSLLAAPAGPPPAPAKPSGDAAPRKRMQFEFEQGELLAPVRIPETVSIIRDEVPHSPPVLVTSAGDVDGGIGGGSSSIMKILRYPPANLSTATPSCQTQEGATNPGGRNRAASEAPQPAETALSAIGKAGSYLGNRPTGSNYQQIRLD